MANTTAIDDLPEDLLVHIISFLPVADATKAAFISSKWRRLWHSSPVFNVCIFSFTSCFKHHFDKSPPEIRRRFVRFANTVIFHRFWRTSWTSPIDKFQITFDYRDYDYKRIVESWISKAIFSKCKVLSISLKNQGYSLKSEVINHHYDKFCVYTFCFQSLIYLNSSVEMLKLQGCRFVAPSATITSLKSLYLENFVFHNSNLTDLLPYCVNLELLSINGTGEWVDLKISSPSLKELILSVYVSGKVLFVPKMATRSVEICAPNLRSLSIDSLCVGNCVLQDANSLVEAYVRFSTMGTKTFHCWSHIIAELSDVERLTVNNIWGIWYKETTGHDEPDTDSDTESIGQNCFFFCGKLSVSMKIFSSDFAFNNLKYLKLLTGYKKRDVLGLGLCLKMCPKLQTLVLVNVYKGDVHDDLFGMLKNKPIHMEIPKLRQVSLLEYKGTRNEVHVIELLKKHKVLLENITAFPAKKSKPIIFWPSSSVYRNVTRSSKAIMG